MTLDHYVGAAERWAGGATLVYGPIARQLVDTSPHPLDGRVVLDAGAGTGVASVALIQRGARPIAADFSHGMLAWEAATRPPATVADVRALPLRDRAVDDSVAAFVLNHLADPLAGLAELVRVTRPGGAVLACVYAIASRSETRDALDKAAEREGWRMPRWYGEMKTSAVPLLGTAQQMELVAKKAGLIDVAVDERPVDVGITRPEQLVAYRLGQAQFSAWLDHLGPARGGEVREALVDAIRPLMRAYRPIVVFLRAATR